MDYKSFFEALYENDFRSLASLIEQIPEDNFCQQQLFRAMVQVQVGNFTNVPSTITQALDIAARKGHDEDVLFGYSILLWVYSVTGNVTDRIVVFQKIEYLLDQVKYNNKYLFYWGKGEYYRTKGIFELENANPHGAIEYFKLGQQIFFEIEDEHGYTECLRLIGAAFALIGNYHQAVATFSDALYIAERIESKEAILAINSCIAGACIRAGNIEMASEALQSIEPLRKTVNLKGVPNITIIYLFNRALLASAQNRVTHALNLYTKVLEIARMYTNPWFISDVLLHLVLLEAEQGNISQTHHYLKIFENINTDALMVKYRWAFVRGLVSKVTASRLQDLIDAKNYFSVVLQEPQFIYQVSTLSTIHYIDILFTEMQLFNSPEILEEINFHLEKLLMIAKSYGSESLLIEVLLLESRIALLEVNGKKMYRSLQKARSLAIKRGLISQVNQIDRFIENYMKEIEKMTSFSQNNDISQLIQEAGIANYLLHVSKILNQPIREGFE